MTPPRPFIGRAGTARWIAPGRGVGSAGSGSISRSSSRPSTTSAAAWPPAARGSISTSRPFTGRQPAALSSPSVSVSGSPTTLL